jgi:catechol 2,3-dioxygenase-like lactoylglutathione lyase family enzyme
MTPPALRYRYAGIRVRDLDRSLRFYQALGFRVRRRGTMEHGGIWVHLALPRQVPRLELNFYPKGTRFYERYRTGSELDHLGFAVRDVSAWVRRMRRAGGRVAVRFTETHESLAYLKDPDGIWIEFYGPPPRRRSDG